MPICCDVSNIICKQINCIDILLFRLLYWEKESWIEKHFVCDIKEAIRDLSISVKNLIDFITLKCETCVLLFSQYYKKATDFEKHC
jgi:hypothetical protein